MPAATQHDTANVELVTIYEISKILSSSLEFKRTLRGVLNVLLTHLQMQHGTVSIIHEGGKLHVLGACDALPEGQTHGSVLELDAGEGLLGLVVKSNSPVVVPDVAREPLFLNRTGRRPEEVEGTAFIGVPIRVGRECIGALAVDRRVEDGATTHYSRDVRLLSLVANLVGQTWKLHQAVAAERENLMLEKHRLQKELAGKYDVANVVGKSKRMKEIFADIHQAAPTNATVLLRGESGTGKEVIAHAIHYLSPRAKAPFIKLNCAALPETLLESELFGHEKGAFTGAAAERKGRFELANGGTLFLDEIGDISPSFQAKLLRVLQEKEFERVGGSKTIKANFRLIAATNKNLEEAVSRGEFRADLYFRINVVTLFVPALRERKEDIPLLVEHFLARFNADNGRRVTMSRDVLEVFINCNWPGNVRELENCIERVATMSRSNEIREIDLPCQKGMCFSSVLLGNQHLQSRPITVHPARDNRPFPPHREEGRDGGRGESRNDDEAADADGPDDGEAFSLGSAGGLTERDRLVQAMERCGWVQAKAARMLGLTPRQMGYALRKYNIEIKRL